MNVKSFKFIGGLEAIAELVTPTGKGYTVRNPLVVHVLRGADGSGQLAFAQWSMVQEPSESVEFFDHALASVPTSVLPEIEKSYIEQTTGLALPNLPSSKILTG